MNVAFERYCAVSRAAARVSIRHASSTPGPLESRRRMGKRNMGELSFGQQSAGAPLWEIANSVDLTQWKWQPPTLQNPPSRHAQAQGNQAPADKRQALDDIISNWMPAGPEPEPEPGPGPTPDFAETCASASAVELEKAVPDETEVLAEQSPPIPWNTNTSAREIADKALNILKPDVYIYTNFTATPNFGRFCRAFSWCLANGWFSDDTICLISRYIRASLPKAVGFLGETGLQRRVDDIKFLLSETMIEGLSARMSNGHATFDVRSWNELLMGISEIRRNGLRIFGEVMALIPKDYLNAVSSGILANIETHLTLCAQGRQDDSLARQANKIKDALQALDPDRNADILAAATEEVFCRVGWDPNYERSRLSWLYVLLRMPNISREYFFRVSATLDTFTSPLTRSDIRQLYLALCRKKQGRLTGTGLYEPVESTETDSFTCYTDLCTRFWKAGQFEYIQDMCRFLEGLSRNQDMFRLMKDFNKAIKTDARPLINLAIGIRHPHLALRIWSLYDECIKQGQDFWISEFGTQAIKELLQAPIRRPRKLLYAMAVVPKSRAKMWTSRIHRTPAITTRQIQKVARLAHTLATSPHLSNREGLRLVTWCIHYFRYHNAPVPPLVLRGLIHNVTRDLAQGRAGRTSRIIWVLRKVHRYAGVDVATRLQLTLQQWRRRNFVAMMKRRSHRNSPSWGAQWELF